MDDSLLAPVRVLAGWIGYQTFFLPCERDEGGRANWRSRFAAATSVTTSSCRWRVEVARLRGCEVASSPSIKAGFLSTGNVGGSSGIDVPGMVVPASNAAGIAGAGRSSMLHLKS